MSSTWLEITTRSTLVAALLAIPNFAHSADPATAPNMTWLSVSGTVVKAMPSSFRLDYGDGVITVEMDDFDFYKEGRHLMENDEVVVFGKIDDDLFEKRTIEASSVYVENLNTHFYASAADEEDFYDWTVVTPVVVGHGEVTGTVSSVDGREFTVDTGAHEIRVDTITMPYNPMDDAGFVKIDKGDRVKVGGPLDGPLFQNGEIHADWIVEYSS